MSGEEKGAGVPTVQVRLATIDYYMAPPMKDHDVEHSACMGGCKLKQVPVVRVFGSTPAGQKVCLHLHRLFPYFFVPLPVDWPQTYSVALDDKVRQLCVSLDAAINQTSRQRATEEGGKKQMSDRQYVLKASVVKGVPFYGYHPQERLWVKIYLLDPSCMKTAAGLLQAGSVMECPLQPHNEHLPYILQVMGDYNLVGMGYINRETPPCPRANRPTPRRTPLPEQNNA